MNDKLVLLTERIDRIKRVHRVVLLDREGRTLGECSRDGTGRDAVETISRMFLMTAEAEYAEARQELKEQSNANHA